MENRARNRDWQHDRLQAVAVRASVGSDHGGDYQQRGCAARCCKYRAGFDIYRFYDYFYWFFFDCEFRIHVS